MAQRKPPSKATGKSSAPGTRRPPAKAASNVSTKKPGAAVAGGRPPARKPGKSIVNQKQTPWGLIITTVVLVLFAGGIVTYAVTRGGNSSGTNSTGGQLVDPADPYRQPELAAAKKIPGVTYRVEAQHTHVQGHITYDRTPPVGGDHSQYWADCAGTVYAQPIANENAVHMLEHGALWITYNAKTLPAGDLATLTKLVDGQDRMALSPYPNLKTPISLQSWGYQLFVDKASDPRVEEFINLLRYNKKTTPEPTASCSQPTFKDKPSTFGNPLWVPAS